MVHVPLTAVDVEPYGVSEMVEDRCDNLGGVHTRDAHCRQEIPVDAQLQPDWARDDDSLKSSIGPASGTGKPKLQAAVCLDYRPMRRGGQDGRGAGADGKWGSGPALVRT